MALDGSARVRSDVKTFFPVLLYVLYLSTIEHRDLLSMECLSLLYHKLPCRMNCSVGAQLPAVAHPTTSLS